MRTSSRRHGNSAGFTLVEVLISASLMAILLTAAYLCLNAALASQKLIEPRIDVLQSARVAMALMTADLRCACPLSEKHEFIGMHRLLGKREADNIDFATHNYTPRRPREGDYCQVSLFLDKDPRTGRVSLWRWRNPTIAPDPLTGGRREELAQSVLGLRLEYFDGEEWYNSWGDVDDNGKPQSSDVASAAASTSSRLRRASLSGLPEAVRITLWLDASPKAAKLLTTESPLSSRPAPEAAPPERGPESSRDDAGTEDVAAATATAEPLVFQTVVRLNLAAGAAAAADAAGGSDQSQPGQTGGGAQ